MSFQPLITIIIPVLNEAKFIEKCLSNLSVNEQVEIIFVDGGSQDNTVNLIKKYNVMVIQSPIAQRSYQMNLGAEKAQGEILLFLHGDTILPANYWQLISQSLDNNEVIAGAFALKIDQQKLVFRLIEKMVNWRSSFWQLPYGDQGLFMQKKYFNQVNGFENLAIMEDFAMVKKLSKLGKIDLIKNPVITSARRWQKLGILKTTLINQLIIIGYYLGIDNQKLAQFYRQVKNQ